MSSPQQLGREFEEELAQEFGLKQVPGSGSVWYSKLDLIGKGIRWSLKFTSKPGLPVTWGDMKLAYEACFGPGGDGSTPYFAFKNPLGTFVIIPLDDFKAMQRGNLNVIEQDKPKVAERKRKARMPELLRDTE